MIMSKVYLFNTETLNKVLSDSDIDDDLKSHIAEFLNHEKFVFLDYGDGDEKEISSDNS